MENVPPRVKWYYGIVSVLIGLFLLGPFAFPLLWKSPRFNLFWKILLTALFTLLTFYLLFASWRIVKFTLDEFKKIGLM